MKSGLVIESNKEYHSDLTAISKSRLCKMSVCPQYFKWCEENPQEPTEDLIFGSAFHKFVLEREDFEKEFCVIPNIDKRTKAGKEMYLSFLEENKEKEIITEEQIETICNMDNSLRKNKYANVLLDGVKEQSIYFTDTVSGIECKIRPDCLKVLQNGNIVITDLKSCKSAMPEDFMRDIAKYSYDLQAYMYCYGVSLAYNVPMDNVSFCFIAVEKKEPHLAGIYEANNDILQRGEMLFRKYIGQLKYCRENDNWYGYNGFTQAPMSIGLPEYLLKNNKGE